MNLNDLKKEIPYKWKPGRMNNKTGVRSPDMAYIDARDVMDLLDEVVGAAHWQKDYKVLGNKMYCGIGIEIPTPMDETGKVTWQWVWKWDMGVESDFEAEKGEASDAFKRAGVCWGIGRFLYDIKTKPAAKPTAPAAPVRPTVRPNPTRTTDPTTLFNGQVPNASEVVAKSTPTPTKPRVEIKYECSVEGCKETVSEGIKEYALKNYGKCLCMKHQLAEGAKS